ncbi:MAG: SRPBCC family protein [Pseudomonadota bacterium]
MRATALPPAAPRQLSLPRSFALPLTLALSLAPGAGAAHAAPAPSETGTVVTDTSQPGRPGKSFAASAVINAPVADICAVLQDYARYPGFMPNVDAVKVVPEAGGGALVDFTLKLPMGKIKKYRLRMSARTAPGACQLAWKMVPWDGLAPEESIVATSGSWQLAPHKGGERGGERGTMVNYTVHTDPGPVPFGLGWIVDSMSRDSIPKTMDALRAKLAR